VFLSVQLVMSGVPPRARVDSLEIFFFCLNKAQSRLSCFLLYLLIGFESLDLLYFHKVLANVLVACVLLVVFDVCFSLALLFHRF
jgi:hypothetical protein